MGPTFNMGQQRTQYGIEAHELHAPISEPETPQVCAAVITD
jgi:hypothetical protein